jgi:hypothetical protein
MDDQMVAKWGFILLRSIWLRILRLGSKIYSILSEHFSRSDDGKINHVPRASCFRSHMRLPPTICKYSTRLEKYRKSAKNTSHPPHRHAPQLHTGHEAQRGDLDLQSGLGAGAAHQAHLSGEGAF